MRTSATAGTESGRRMNSPRHTGADGDISNIGATTDNNVLRILVPITAGEASRRGLRYALNQFHEGRQVEVILLHVGEPIESWEVLHFRTQQEIDEFQTERAQAFFEEAATALVAEQIPCRGFFKQGEVVFSILDLAEEMDCKQIAMPATGHHWWQLFGRDVVGELQRRHRAIPVVTVDRAGHMVGTTSQHYH